MCNGDFHILIDGHFLLSSNYHWIFDSFFTLLQLNNLCNNYEIKSNTFENIETFERVLQLVLLHDQIQYKTSLYFKYATEKYGHFNKTFRVNF